MSFSDRPETISGLSEWPYAVPFSYRALMSGDPKLCSSLVSDGFEDEPADQKTRLYAISSDFELGYARLKKLLAAVRSIAVTRTADLLIQAVDETQNFWRHTETATCFSRPSSSTLCRSQPGKD
jgi:hypothetical protein